MSIDQKLSELEIKRILVVDDRVENVIAAKQAFSKYTTASIEYASSASEAIKMMDSAFKDGKKYDLIISDLEMETKTAGLDVVKEAIIQLSYATIATGANYDRSKHESHGATTTILPTGASIKGKKEEPEIWDFALDESIRYARSAKGIDPTKNSKYDSSVRKSVERFTKYVGKLPDFIAEQMLEQYKR